MIKRLLALGLAAAALIAQPAAAQVSYVTGPAPASDFLAVTNQVIQNINATLDPLGSGTMSSAITIPTTANSVNTVQIAGSATGNPVSLSSTGSDANPPLVIYTQGTGALGLGGATTATSPLLIPTVASVANQVTLTAGAAGVNVTLAVTGTDSNPSLLLQSKGTGVVAIGGSSKNSASLAAINTNNSVNAVLVTGGATGNPPTITVGGNTSDTNSDISIAGKGTGLLQLGTSGMFIANASVATVLGSVGPTGSHTTVQKWLQVKDSTGTVLYIPAF